MPIFGEVRNIFNSYNITHFVRRSKAMLKEPVVHPSWTKSNQTDYIGGLNHSVYKPFVTTVGQRFIPASRSFQK